MDATIWTISTLHNTFNGSFTHQITLEHGEAIRDGRISTDLMKTTNVQTVYF